MHASIMILPEDGGPSRDARRKSRCLPHGRDAKDGGFGASAAMPVMMRHHRMAEWPSVRLRSTSQSMMEPSD